MRYSMTQKVFSPGDDFVIKDQTGQEVYLVDGKLFSVGHKLSFQDMHGNELARIRQKLLTWGPTYEIAWDGGSALVKKQMFTLLRCAFTVDVPGPGDLDAHGDLLHHEYTFTRGGNVVAQVSKRWFTVEDTYGVEVSAGESAVLILASAVVIDLCCHAGST